jgi:electron transfer flavoprotein beta subunit
MKILVCVKQVPVPEAIYEIDPGARWVTPGSGVEYQMNRYDECAVEEAVRIKEAFPETVIDVLSIGPSRADAVIRRAMGMGADDGIHIMTRTAEFHDPFTIAYWIAAMARRNTYDLIFTGIMSEDMMQGQIGPLTAELLSIPCATAVVSAALHKNNVHVEREIEGGYRESVELKLPALLTIQSGIHTPRYPSLSNLLRANKQPVHTIEARTLAHPGDRQAAHQVKRPQNIRNGIFLEGTTEVKADQLLKILMERSFL